MNAIDLEEQIRSLYGEVDWTRARGILHVMAIMDRRDAVIAIGPGAPRSATDRFVLGLARARSELILTTGAILRAESKLEHRYAEDEETNESFVRWRRKTLGLDQAPALLVFSGSGDIPSDHPALQVARAGMVWTSKAGRARLGPSAGGLSVEEGFAGDGGTATVGETVAAGEAATLAKRVGALLRAARSRFPARRILLEAGPRLSAAFYRKGRSDCPRLDELLLSRFEGEVVSAAVGPKFESIAEIRQLFPEAPTSMRIEESSGVWRFERYRASVSEWSNRSAG